MFHKLKDEIHFQVLQCLLIKLLSIRWLYFQGQKTSNTIKKGLSQPPKKDNYKMYTLLLEKL